MADEASEGRPLGSAASGAPPSNSTSALSQALRGPETRLGVRLFNRTNRAATLTEAGADLPARLEGGLGAIEEGLEAPKRGRGKAAGHLRLDVLPDAARLVLGPALSGFLADYLEVKLEVVVQDDVIDIVGEGFRRDRRLPGGLAGGLGRAATGGWDAAGVPARVGLGRSGLSRLPLQPQAGPRSSQGADLVPARTRCIADDQTKHCNLNEAATSR